MNQTQKAEQLRLPEQLYILLIDPQTGEPRFDRERVRRVLATSVLWELLNLGALRADGNRIVEVKGVVSLESYLRAAAMLALKAASVSITELLMDIASELHPIWQAIGEAMVAEHLLTEEVRTRFCFFHTRVLTELAEARKEGLELSDDLKEAVRNVWDPNYDDNLAHTHPRLLARLVLLDNYGLLPMLIGSSAYYQAAPHLESLRAHVQELLKRPADQPVKTTARKSTDSGSDSSSWGDNYIYDSGCDFWVGSDSHNHDASGGHDHGGFFDGLFGDSDGHGGHGDGGHGGDSGSDGGAGGGDGGGGCGGCGGCGGG